MAGHSKWANIRHRKGAQDAKKGKLFTRIIREISISARIGGPHLNSNPRLRKAVHDAKSNNMPNQNIERAIQKGAGLLPGMQYEEIFYERVGIPKINNYIGIKTNRYIHLLDIKNKYRVNIKDDKTPI